MLRQFTTHQLITQEVIRACSHILQGVGTYGREEVTISTDAEAFENLDSTFITIGGPVVNEITEWALRERSNRFLRFSRCLKIRQIDNDHGRLK